MKILAVLFSENPDLYINIINLLVDKLQYKLIGVVSNKRYMNLKNYSLEDINSIDYDFIIYDINKHKLNNAYHWLYLLKQAFIKKYEDCNDSEILNTIEYWKNNDLSVFNQYVTETTFDEVFLDEELPYIYLPNSYKKIYYPLNYNNFIYKENKYYIYNFLTEQIETSPHLYTTDTHKVNEGDILIDAGTCEGNFAIKYVDICSKIYLIESDKNWIETLNYTFKNYKDKVEIIPKILSNINDNNNITLDYICSDLKNKNIFLKMDIEGAESLALQSGKNMLANNKVNASICTYHTKDDLIKIKSLLEQYNFNYKTSNGYMIFLSDLNVFDTLNFRKGVLYASNYLKIV